MKLLTSVFLRDGRVLPANGWFTLAVCAFVAGLEVAGRYATSDLHDGLAAFGLIGAVTLVAVRHKREPLAWVVRLAAAGRRVAASAAWLRYDHGIDLRGTPPLPRRTPPVVFALVLALVAWGALAAGAWARSRPAGASSASTHRTRSTYCS